MVFIEILAYLIIGALSGILAGLLGVGGGVVIVPCLVLVFNIIGVPKDVLMQLAVGTSLASIIFTSYSSSLAHNRKHSLDWGLLKKIMTGTMLGAVLGTVIARWIPSKGLEIVFGVFECALAIYFFFMKPPHDSEKHHMPSSWIVNLVGFFIGTISTTLGIGGGYMSVPTFVHFKVPMTRAIGTSAALTLVISAVGTLAYLLPELAENFYLYSLGYIYIPAFIPISLAAYVTAPSGVRLAHVLPTNILKKIFAVVLLAAGILMIIN